jgi:predicted secreted protein
MTYTKSQAQAGRGSQLSIGSSPILVGEVKDVPLNRGKWDSVDVTNFESGSDSEMLVTIRKPGTVTFTGNRVSDDAGQMAVETAYQDGELMPFTLQLPKTAAQSSVGDTYSFNAYVLSYDFKDAVAAAIEFSIDLQMSGPCTLALGS